MVEVIVWDGWSSDPIRPPEPSKPPPFVVVVVGLETGSSSVTVVALSFELDCPAGFVVVASVELGNRTTVVVLSSLDVLSLEVGLSREPRFRSPPSEVVEVDDVEVEVEFARPLPLPLPLPSDDVSAGTRAGPVVDVVN